MVAECNLRRRTARSLEILSQTYKQESKLVICNIGKRKALLSTKSKEWPQSPKGNTAVRTSPGLVSDIPLIRPNLAGSESTKDKTLDPASRFAHSLLTINCGKFSHSVTNCLRPSDAHTSPRACGISNPNISSMLSLGS